LETGELCDKSLVKNDTLYNDLKFADDTILQKAKVILANEPMGLKNIIHASCCSRIKDLKIRGTKAEPLFLQLFMEALDDGGRCAVIVPDGVLFNDSTLHNDTRKYMVENFNLKKVVALSDDFFLNTGVKTSILYFTKDGKKTEEVEFSSIKLKNSEIDETSIIKVKYDDLRKNKFSLFVNKYNVQAVEKVGGVEYKKIGDICEFISSKFNSGIMDNSGQYNFYNGKAENPDGTHSEYNFDYDEYLAIIKGGGAGQGKYGNQIGLGKTFYLKGKNAVSNGLYVLKVNDKKINVKYLYHYLLQNKNIIMDLATYTTGLGNIKQETLKLLEIPIPSLTIQKQIVESLDLLSENITTSKKQIEESKKILHKYVQCQTVHEKDVKLNEFCIFNSENLTNDKNIKFINYIDIGSIDNEKITNITKLTEDFPSRAKRLVKKNDILLSSVRPNLRKYVFINENIENGVCSTGFCVIRPNPEIVNPKYIYYQISSDSATEYLTSNATGSQYPAVNCDIIENISIKVPPLNKQNDIVKYCENNEIMINLNEDRIKNNEDLMKQILNEYLKNNDDSKKENNESGESSSDSEKEDTKVKNIKEKKIVKKVAKKEESSLSDSEEEKTANKNSKTKK
jgi:restriction endonuclease S subunit